MSTSEMVIRLPAEGGAVIDDTDESGRPVTVTLDEVTTVLLMEATRAVLATVPSSPQYRPPAPLDGQDGERQGEGVCGNPIPFPPSPGTPPVVHDDGQCIVIESRTPGLIVGVHPTLDEWRYHIVPTNELMVELWPVLWRRQVELGEGADVAIGETVHSALCLLSGYCDCGLLPRGPFER